MEELYVEGLATHGVPESCVDVPRGRGEALTGARAGRAIEPRNERIGVPTLSKERKATLLAALPRVAGGPRVGIFSAVACACRMVLLTASRTTARVCPANARAAGRSARTSRVGPQVGVGGQVVDDPCSSAESPVARAGVVRRSKTAARIRPMT